VRVAIQALAAVLGGTQSLHTNSLDETLALPSEEAVTIALRTQQIIAEESGVTNTIDPLAGSYFVETLTDRVEAEAMAYIDKIDALGGIVAAIEAGFPQKEIADASYRYQQQIDRKEKSVVGVNKHLSAKETPIEILKISEAVEKEQKRRLAEVRARRDSNAHASSLAAIEADARSGENLMPRILQAVRDHASVGEICGAMKTVFGEYREVSVF
jgi:methylmalonyl-CoA mutase N-terminal domain/subunit